MVPMSYVYVFLTVFLTVFGQVVIKWQVLQAGAFPPDAHGKLLFLAKLLINPWIVLALAAALAAAVSWMAAMTRLELSHAYPFMSLAFILVLVFSALLFNEPVTVPKIVGLLLISVGIIVGSQG
jgi:multidrug transporter EmrE-like cation transporter